MFWQKSEVKRLKKKKKTGRNQVRGIKPIEEIPFLVGPMRVVEQRKAVYFGWDGEGS